jgi:hypothetical protein
MIKIGGVEYEVSDDYLRRKNTRKLGTYKLILWGMFWYIICLMALSIFLSAPLAL